jgi:hypothetical protein
MGFALTIIFFVSAYLGPATIFGPLAAFHIELILAALVFFVSIPTLAKSYIWKTPQYLALIGLALATFMSLLVTGWAGGALQVFLNFIPNAFAYFLVCLHCNSVRKLKTLVFVLLFVCLFVIANGYSDLQHATSQTLSAGQEPAETPYLLPMKSDAGDWFYRIRGQDFINYPNDFAQLIACVIPLIFIFWRRKKFARNFVFVILPLCLLLYGSFLTHSRGCLLAIMGIIVVMARRRIGTILSLLAAAGLFTAASALHFTGGRDISADSGAERMDLWSDALQLLKSHPLFGVGYGNLPDYMGRTAHNSVMVCAAELGLIGLYFWSLFLFPTLKNALMIASPVLVGEGKPIIPDKARFPEPMRKIETLDREEINNLGQMMVMSFTGFLVAGWFLSRAFTMTLFLLGGINQVFFEMALQRGMIGVRMPMAVVVRHAGIFTISLLVLTYLVLRIGNILR